MGDGIRSEFLVIATVAHKEKTAQETYDFTPWHESDGPETVQAALEELARVRGRSLRDGERLSFLNVQPNKVDGGKHTVVISMAAQGTPCHASLEVQGCKTRQELLRAAVEQLPESVRTGAVEFFCVDPAELDTSD